VADRQSANSQTGVIVAEGNVTIRYPAQQVVARSQKATYYTQERRIVLEGNVDVIQNQNHLQAQTVTYRIGDRIIEALPVQGRQVESIYVFPSETQAGGTVEKTETSEPL
jgi:lipopolysaccharide export system protein LptA